MTISAFRGHGFLVLNKPAGITSAKAIQPLKKMCQGKVGHVGTLDPFATGMLVVSIGHATKFASHQLKESKKYETCIQLGSQTDTQDITGEIVQTLPVPNLTKATIQKVLCSSFTGHIMQKPSKYSALKYQGKPYYYYARKGLEIPIQERPVTIHAIELSEYDATHKQISLSVICSSGTYIRALAEDIAQELGTCGFVKTLHRSYITPWADAPLYSPESCDISNLALRIQKTDTVLKHYPATQLSDAEIRKLQQGQTLSMSQDIAEGTWRIYSKDKVFAGLAACTGGILKAQKILPPSLD